MNNNLYINEYLNIINEFNQDNFVHYKPYKGIQIYINRTHVLQRLEKRYSQIEYLNYIKRFMYKFIKDNKYRFNQILIINPRGIFLTVKSNNDKNYKQKYFALQLQYKNEHYSLLLSSPLPFINQQR